MIPDAVINEVRDRTDIVQLIGRHVPLRRTGSSFKGCCPFHQEKSPSFHVSPVRNRYHCFGCGASGDAFRFLVEHQRYTFPEAVRELAGACGVEIPEEERESPEARAERLRQRSLSERLLTVQDQLAAYYTERLFGPAGAAGRTYLDGRGVKPETASAFRLGWADGDRRAFEHFVSESGVALEDLVTLGVILPPTEGLRANAALGGARLRFRDRVMFPVIDLRGEVRGFSGRILDARQKVAKYINSPETPVYTKGEQLYGAHTARDGARREGRVILVEGNLDVVMLWQAGFAGAVAAMGTALTSTQVRLAKRLCEQVVCVMDGDAAGSKAAFASLLPFLEAGVTPRAVRLDERDDPDTFVRREGAEAFGQLVEGAPPLIDLFVDHQVALHPSDAPGRAAALREIARPLARLDDELMLELYREKVAAALSVTPALVDRAVTTARATADEERRAAREAERRSAATAGPDVRSPVRAGGRPSATQRAGHDARPRRAESAAPPPDPPPLFDAQPWGEAELEPPPPAFTGLEAVEEDGRMGGARPTQLPPRAIPRFVHEVIEFVMLNPRSALRLRDQGIIECLTHAPLAGFVSRLCHEIDLNPSPNLDRLLTELNDPPLVAFLRERQARRRTIDRSHFDEAFDDAIGRLVRESHLEKRRTVLRTLNRCMKSEPRDAEQLDTLRGELARIGMALQGLKTPHSEGAQ